MYKLIQLLCVFVPMRRWRRAIFRKYVDPGRWLAKNTKAWNHISDWRIEAIAGVKVAIGVFRNGATIYLGHMFSGDQTSFVASAIFQKHEYHFSHCGNAVVIDIGMNVGFASLSFALRDDVKAIYAFEPVGPVYEKALFNFSLNPCAAKITAFNYGLGDGEKELRINYDASCSAFASSRIPHRAWGRGTITVQIKDAAAEIHRIIAGHPQQRIVVKCDCEGDEKDIFARLDEENLLSSIDIIVMEYHISSDSFIEPLLRKHGFVYFKDGNFQEGIIRACRNTNT